MKFNYDSLIIVNSSFSLMINFYKSEWFILSVSGFSYLYSVIFLFEYAYISYFFTFYWNPQNCMRPWGMTKLILISIHLTIL